MVKNLPAIQETWVRSLGGEDPLEKGMATHSSILPGEFHGQRSLEGYSPWDHKKSDRTEQLTLSLASHCLQVIHHSKYLAQPPAVVVVRVWGSHQHPPLAGFLIMLLVLGSPDLTFGSTQEISETCVQVRKQQLVLDMEQQTDSK